MLFSYPLYCYGMPASLKAFADRTMPLSSMAMKRRSLRNSDLRRSCSIPHLPVQNPALKFISPCRAIRQREHIEPRNPRKGSSTKTLDYSNIVASCNSPDRCGTKKGNDYDASKFISPLNPECEDTFIYYPDGKMEGNDYTIGLLNLNSYELKEARKAVYQTLSKLDKSTIEMIYCQDDENLFPFYNVIKWVVKNSTI